MLCPSCGQENPLGAQFCNACGARLDSRRDDLTELSAESEPTWVRTGSQFQSVPITAPASPSRGAFIGRQREMERLKAALEEALAGRGRLVMLAGEPGIGKTRTAQELGAHAETLGVQVLWGRCFEEEGTPPYWPWVQPIRSYIRQQDPEELASEMGKGAANIAEIVSQVREKLPNLEPPPTWSRSKPASVSSTPLPLFSRPPPSLDP